MLQTFPRSNALAIGAADCRHGADHLRDVLTGILPDSSPKSGISLHDLLHTCFTTDLHFVAYMNGGGDPDATQGCRYRKDFITVGSESIAINYLVVDLDLPKEDGDHRAWLPGEYNDWLRDFVDPHPIASKAYTYSTTHGARFLFTLENTVSLDSPSCGDAWESTYLIFLSKLAPMGHLIPDPACKDWTRLYRAPNVRRIYKKGPFAGQTLDATSAIHSPNPTPIPYVLNRNAVKGVLPVAQADLAPSLDPAIQYAVERMQNGNTDLLEHMSGTPLFLWALNNPESFGYEVWRGIGSNIYFAESGEAGRELFHRLSREHSQYSEAATDDEWRKFGAYQAGPISYQSFAHSLPADIRTSVAVDGTNSLLMESRQARSDDLERMRVQSLSAKTLGPYIQSEDVMRLLSTKTVGTGDKAREVIVANAHNLRLILTRDSLFDGAFSIDAQDSYAPKYRGEFIDEPIAMEIKALLDRVYVQFPLRHILYTAVGLCKHHVFHSVQDYLMDLKWDGLDRTGTVIEAIGCEDTAYTRNIIEKWLISVVCRPLQIPTTRQTARPKNTKVDTMLILLGAQGTRKSTFFQALIPDQDWFLDNLPDLENKDASLQMRSRWLVEMSEFERYYKTSKSTAEIKAFISRTDESMRVPYGKAIDRKPRSAILVGTSNVNYILSDMTGNRRFWVLEAGGKDEGKIQALRHARDQVWAQAVSAYTAGKIWWMSTTEEDQSESNNRRYMSETPQELAINEYLQRNVPRVVISQLEYEGGFTTSEILREAFLQVIGEVRKSFMRSVSETLRNLDFVNRVIKKDGSSQRVWIREIPEGHLNLVPSTTPKAGPLEKMLTKGQNK